jgi:methionyl-tRNA formyltransferase
MTASVFLVGDGPTAPSALRSLLAACHVAGVIRSPYASPIDPVGDLARAAGVPIHTVTKLAEVRLVLETHRPDAVAISSFNRIMTPAILRLSRFVNVHYSPLPRYRGRANVNWALINGDAAAAISIHHVNEGLDDGGILFQEAVPIGPEDTATTLYERLNAVQERELGAAVLRALAGDAGVAQDEAAATYGCARTPDDGEIDWSLPSARIDRLIRALAPPFPSAFTFLEGRRLRILRATPQPDAARYDGRVAGRVVGLSRKEGWVDVLTGDGVLRIHDIAGEAGEALAPAEVISSSRMTLGLSRMDLLRRVHELEARLSALEAEVRSARAAGDATLEVPA